MRGQNRLEHPHRPPRTPRALSELAPTLSPGVSDIGTNSAAPPHQCPFLNIRSRTARDPFDSVALVPWEWDMERFDLPVLFQKPHQGEGRTRTWRTPARALVRLRQLHALHNIAGPDIVTYAPRRDVPEHRVLAPDRVSGWRLSKACAHAPAYGAVYMPCRLTAACVHELDALPPTLAIATVRSPAQVFISRQRSSSGAARA